MANEQPIANQAQAEQTGRRPGTRRSPFRAFIWTAVLGTGFGLLATLMVAGWLSGDRMPAIDAAAIERASARWDTSAPVSYDMQLRLGGPREQDIEIEVRERNVTKLLLDDVAPRQRRTWDYWSVPGLFDIIEADLTRAGKSPPGRVRLFAEFDPKYCYPRRYRRIESSAMRNSEWTVTRFEVIAD